jgi:hypothetical protein
MVSAQIDTLNAVKSGPQLRLNSTHTSVENPWKAAPVPPNSLIYHEMTFPSHGRGRRFNPYSAHQLDQSLSWKMITGPLGRCNHDVSGKAHRSV